MQVQSGHLGEVPFKLLGHTSIGDNPGDTGRSLRAGWMLAHWLNIKHIQRLVLA